MCIPGQDSYLEPQAYHADALPVEIPMPPDTSTVRNMTNVFYRLLTLTSALFLIHIDWLVSGFGS